MEETTSHVQHCIEYLRVTLMCHADTTLEGGEYVDAFHRAEGMGTVHMCKNWDDLLGWANIHTL